MKHTNKKLLMLGSIALAFFVASNLSSEAQAGCCPPRTAGASNYISQCNALRNNKGPITKRRSVSAAEKQSSSESKLIGHLSKHQLPKEQEIMRRAAYPRQPNFTRQMLKNRKR